MGSQKNYFKTLDLDREKGCNKIAMGHHQEDIIETFFINLLWGGANRPHNVRDLCADGTLSCIADPATWQEGQWQALNKNLLQRSQSPFFARQGFADRFQEHRDEFWVGMTYQF